MARIDAVSAIGPQSAAPQSRAGIPSYHRDLYSIVATVTKQTRLVDAYSDQSSRQLADPESMRKMLRVLAAATLVCSVCALRLPDLDAKIDVNTNLSEASLAVQNSICAPASVVWAAFLSADFPLCRCRILLTGLEAAACLTQISLKV